MLTWLRPLHLEDDDGEFLVHIYPGIPDDVLAILNCIVKECIGIHQEPVDSDADGYSYTSYHFSLYIRMGKKVRVPLFVFPTLLTCYRVTIFPMAGKLQST